MNQTLVLVIVFFVLGISSQVRGDVEILDKVGGIVKISQSQKRWELREKVCVVRVDKELACGRVVEADDFTASIDLGDVASEIRTGDRFQTYDYRLDNLGIISAGVELGSGYYFPYLHLQYALTVNWHLGFWGAYSRNTTQGFAIKNYGARATLNYYADYLPFRNFWFLLGVGLYNISVTPPAQAEMSNTVVNVMSTVGYRHEFTRRFNAGFGIGFQYLPDKFPTVPLGWRDFEFVAHFDVGIWL